MLTMSTNRGLKAQLPIAQGRVRGWKSPNGTLGTPWGIVSALKGQLS